MLFTAGHHRKIAILDRKIMYEGSLKEFLRNRHTWMCYGLLYALPWILLPVNAIFISLPFIILVWRIRLKISYHYIKNPDSPLKRFFILNM